MTLLQIKFSEDLSELYVNGDNVTYFDNTGVEYMPRKIKQFIDNKNVTTNLYRLKAYGSIRCGYFFSVWVFFHEHSQITGLQGKGKAFL